MTAVGNFLLYLLGQLIVGFLVVWVLLWVIAPLTDAKGDRVRKQKALRRGVLAWALFSIAYYLIMGDNL